MYFYSKERIRPCAAFYHPRPLLYMAERVANRISQFNRFFYCEVHRTAQLRASLRSFGIFAARNPSLQDLSSFTACLYTGAVALPTSLCLGGPMRQTSSRRSPKPIVDKRLVLRARWATVQVTVSSASHLSVCLPFFDSSSACTGRTQRMRAAVHR